MRTQYDPIFADGEGLLQFGNNLARCQHALILVGKAGQHKAYLIAGKTCIAINHTQQIIENLIGVTFDSLHGNVAGEDIHTICQSQLQNQHGNYAASCLLDFMTQKIDQLTVE